MSKKTYLRWGACGALVLAFWLLWMPSEVSAAAGGPQGGDGEKSCPTVHKVALGENLTQIAAEHEVSLAALIEENGLADANLIVEGQALCIPAHSGGGHAGGGHEGAGHESSGGEDWGSYGVPGQSYDPSMIRKEANGPQQGYGPQESGGEPEVGHEARRPYMEPGKSYDPSVWSEESHAEEYGPTQPTGSYDRYLGVPGKAYDPSTHQGSKQQEYDRYSRPMEDDEIDPNDGEEPEEPEEPGNGENGDGETQTP